MRKLYFCFFIGIITLTSCASKEQQAFWQQSAARTPTCEGKDDSNAMWARAVEWVQDNSAYRFQIQSENLIQTAGPNKDSVQSAISITKRPLGNGNALLNFQSGCDNMFGCQPSAVALKASFNNYVIQQ